MAIRSHLTRDFGFRRRTHRLILAIGLVTGALAVIALLDDSKPTTVLLAPVLVGVVWALTREIDPDHDWTAIVAGAFAGWWVLTEGSALSALAVAGLLAAARMMSETTGRRPLASDVAVLAALGTGIAFTAEGWVAGLGVAAAMYLDHRHAERRLRLQPWVAASTTLGATLVAWLTGVELRPGDVSTPMAVAAAVTALLLIVRRPALPLSVVDARRGTPLSSSRLHMSRAVIGIVVYGMTVVVGSVHVEHVVPLLAAVSLVIVSNEVERARRKS